MCYRGHGAPHSAMCLPGAVWRPRAARGVSWWPVSLCQGIRTVRVSCAAAGPVRPPPPPACSGVWVAGGSGGGPRSWGLVPVGGAPVCLSGLDAPSAGSLFWPTPIVPLAARVAAVAVRRTAGGGGGKGWRSRALGAAVSGQWLRGLQCSARPRSPCHPFPSLCLRPFWPPGWGAARGGGGGCSGLGGLDMLSGALRAAGQLPPPSPAVWGPRLPAGVPAGRQAIAVGAGYHLCFCSGGGWVCGGGGFLGW